MHFDATGGVWASACKWARGGKGGGTGEWAGKGKGGQGRGSSIHHAEQRAHHAVLAEVLGHAVLTRALRYGLSPSCVTV